MPNTKIARDPTELAQEEKRRKDAKKGARRLLAGKTQLSEEEYEKLQQQVADNKKLRRKLVFNRVTKFPIPSMLHINNLKVDEPGFYLRVVRMIDAGDVIIPGRSWDFVENRAIWYNELNRGFTFDTHTNSHAKTACGLVFRAMRNKTLHEVPGLLSVFALACHERRTTPRVYCLRDTFLEMWYETEDVFKLPTRKQVSKFNRIAKELKSALPASFTKEIAGTSGDAVPDKDVDEEMRDNFEPDFELLVNNPSEFELDAELDDSIYQAPLPYRRALHSDWIDEQLEKMEKEVQNLLRYTPDDTETIADFNKEIDIFVDGEKLQRALEKMRVLPERDDESGDEVDELREAARERQAKDDEDTIQYGMRHMKTS